MIDLNPPINTGDVSDVVTPHIDKALVLELTPPDLSKA